MTKFETYFISISVCTLWKFRYDYYSSFKEIHWKASIRDGGRRIMQILHGFYLLSQFVCLFLTVIRIRSLLQRLFLFVYMWFLLMPSRLKKSYYYKNPSFVCRHFMDRTVLNKLICINQFLKYRGRSFFFQWDM